MLERAHLDRQRRRARELLAPRERGVEIGRAHDAETADVLLAFGVEGPSVSSSSPSLTRTTVAVVGGKSPSEKTHAPADFISCVSAFTSRMMTSRFTDGGGGPSG